MVHKQIIFLSLTKVFAGYSLESLAVMLSKPETDNFRWRGVKTRGFQKFNSTYITIRVLMLFIL